MSFDFNKPSSRIQSCVARRLTKLSAMQAALQEAAQAKAAASAAAADAASAKETAQQEARRHSKETSKLREQLADLQKVVCDTDLLREFNTHSPLLLSRSMLLWSYTLQSEHITEQEILLNGSART